MSGDPEYGLKEIAPGLTAVETAAPALPPEFWQRTPDGQWVTVRYFNHNDDRQIASTLAGCLFTEAEALEVEGKRKSYRPPA